MGVCATKGSAGWGTHAFQSDGGQREIGLDMNIIYNFVEADGDVAKNKATF